jgi:hypothetical protein
MKAAFLCDARFKHGLQSALARIGAWTEEELRPALRDLPGQRASGFSWSSRCPAPILNRMVRYLKYRSAA